MIEELVGRVFSARDAAHKEHWSTNSYAQHVALGDFYEEIITSVDELVECYQGHMTVLKSKDISSTVPKYDLFSDYLSDEADWIESNRSIIAQGSEHLMNIVDGLTAIYTRTAFKLTRLK